MGAPKPRRANLLKLWISIGVLSAGLSGASSASAENYLVKNQSAFKEATKRLEPGDKIVLANGVWRDFEIVFEAYGNEDNPISLIAETPGEVIISGQSNLRIGGEHLIVHGLTFKDGYSPTKEVISFRRDSKTLANNSRLVETVIIDFNKPDRTTDDHWIAVFGKNNRVDHNYFAGKTNKGPTLVVRLNTPESRENGHVIDHNFFGHRPSLGGNGGETIRIGVSDYSRTRSETIIARNYFERCDGEVEIISNKSEGNTIAENVFYESRGAVVLRHGGDNTISRNIFFGNGVTDTGGVRIINENQTVQDNYFEGLRGQKFLSALTIMNGVPNSPINRYHQVKNATVSNNSFVDIASIGLAVGSDEERSAPPIDSAFQRNLVITDEKSPVAVFDDISGIIFQENISNNAELEKFGASIEPAIKLVRSENGLLYPETKEGVDSVGAPRDLNPVKRDATGPSWFEKAAQSSTSSRKTKVGKSAAALEEAVATSQPGDTLLLAKFHYELEKPISLEHALTIVGKKKRDRKTILSSAGASVFDLKAGAELNIKNIKFEVADANDAIIKASGEIYEGAYKLDVINVALAAGDGSASIPFLKADAATFAESISIEGFTVSDWSGSIVSLSGEKLEGWYLADDVSIKNSTFENVGGSLIDFGREGRDESTFGPRFKLVNSELTNVGIEGRALNLKGIDGLIVRGNTFNDSGSIYFQQRVLGLTFTFEQNEINNTPNPEIYDVNGELRGEIGAQE